MMENLMELVRISILLEATMKELSLLDFPTVLEDSLTPMDTTTKDKSSLEEETDKEFTLLEILSIEEISKIMCFTGKVNNKEKTTSSVEIMNMEQKNLEF